MATPQHITHLRPAEVFVFGSNRAGRHGLGAAKTALKWGAVHGQGGGRMGQTYGIPTKGLHLERLTVAQIGMGVVRFLRYAEAHPEAIFLVTPIACGLASHPPREIAPLFRPALKLSNVVLPQAFLDILAPGS